MLLIEDNIYSFAQVAGIDEAGRGSLAGPVVAAAVILHPDQPVGGLKDSKKLSSKRRRQLFEEIRSKAVCWAVGRATAVEIDKLNVHNATLLAMQRAWDAVPFEVVRVLVDGLYCPELATPCTAIVKGDQSVPVISAASILAKVTRDEEMLKYHNTYSQYGFDRHKGYPTAQHIAALQEHGPSDLHRKSYRPVRDVLHLQTGRSNPRAKKQSG